jgi:hypothetical protein
MKRIVKQQHIEREKKAMLNDPRTKARSFLESSSIVSEIEDVLNHLIYEKPDDLHGFLVSRKIFHEINPLLFLYIYRQIILWIKANNHKFLI